MKILGIDVGEKRIGLAISDDMQMIARELEVVPIENFQVRFSQILAENEIGKIVIGRPRNLAGDLGPQAKRVEEFAKANIEPSGKEIVWEDETLTSVKAEEELKSRGVTSRDIKSNIDAVAAKIILQSYLRSL